jgi:hypothetical protein
MSMAVSSMPNPDDTMQQLMHLCIRDNTTDVVKVTSPLFRRAEKRRNG